MNKENFDFLEVNSSNTVEIDAAGKVGWQVKEEFKTVNRHFYNTLVINRTMGHGQSEIEFLYPDYLELSRDVIFYPKCYNKDKFKIGELELEYCRSKINMSWFNERSVEVPLGQWFTKKFNNDIVEIGDVLFQYSELTNWPVIDPMGTYEKCLRIDAMDYDYSGSNVVSLSTLEHLNESEYNKHDSTKPIKAVEKIINESKNYLITIPVGYNISLQDYIERSGLPFVVMVRENRRGCTNNWYQSFDKNDLFLTFGAVELRAGYYGNSIAIIIISNQDEILNKTKK